MSRHKQAQFYVTTIMAASLLLILCCIMCTNLLRGINLMNQVLTFLMILFSRMLKSTDQ